jgi:hypothetical protein
MSNFLIRPELLLHPNIPKALHGINPRSILGKKWWDIVRQKAYAKYDYHCYACGVHKSEAKYHKWLEAHEVYDINYSTGKVEMTELVALCHSCHNYIHDFRLQQLVNCGKIDLKKYIAILNHGEQLIKPYLAKNAINYKGQDWKKPFQETLPFHHTFPHIIVPHLPEPTKDTVDWNDWYLALNSNKYYSRFTDYNEWQSYYQWLNNSNLKDTPENLALFKSHPQQSHSFHDSLSIFSSIKK